jgi:molybdopterin/thiamine biosynthesis adenylyltransferase
MPPDWRTRTEKTVPLFRAGRRLRRAWAYAAAEPLRHGVARIGFCDGDVVSRSNLNASFCTHRAISADRKRNPLTKSYPRCAGAHVGALRFYLTKENAQDIVGLYDVVVLAVDSLPARLVVNEACVSKRVTLIDGGINACTERF